MGVCFLSLTKPQVIRWCGWMDLVQDRQLFGSANDLSEVYTPLTTTTVFIYLYIPNITMKSEKESDGKNGFDVLMTRYQDTDEL